jgi:hypothetical protein
MGSIGIEKEREHRDWKLDLGWSSPWSSCLTDPPPRAGDEPHEVSVVPELARKTRATKGPFASV